MSRFSWMSEKVMLRGLVIVALSSAAFKAFAADEPLVAPAEPAEMRRLFNGEDLAGWAGDPRLWSVKNGVIRGETTAENPAQGNTFIIWKEGVTKDFDLRLSFRRNATNNSGIQYRSKHITNEQVQNKWVVRGYQHEIRNENTLPDVAGFIYDEGGKRGRMCLVGEKAVWEPDGKKIVTSDLIDGPGFQELFKLDDWNDVVRGGRLRGAQIGFVGRAGSLRDRLISNHHNTESRWKGRPAVAHVARVSRAVSEGRPLPPTNDTTPARSKRGALSGESVAVQ